jgi:hypothetical protein
MSKARRQAVLVLRCIDDRGMLIFKASSFFKRRWVGPVRQDRNQKSMINPFWSTCYDCL